ncbi:MAG TPA: leucine-rich repeat domain-containing protein [Pirellulales bacterium]|jgi:hypothetical protein|nr:leucine-rich repeat domain-containing protein [Pirellulales bacterium]
MTCSCLFILSFFRAFALVLVRRRRCNQQADSPVRLNPTVFIAAAVVCLAGCGASPEQTAKSTIEQLGGKTRSDRGHVVMINLRKSRATDNDLAGIRQFTMLDRVALPPAATDAGLRHLEGLPNLTSLDLQNTQVTDQGLDVLKTMPKLVQVYIHGSKVTPEGEQALQAALPRLTIEKFPVAQLGPDF